LREEEERESGGVDGDAGPLGMKASELDEELV